MNTKLTLVALLGLSLAGNALADSPKEPVKTLGVRSCPMEDKEFYSTSAVALGYEHMINGDLEKASVCYKKASEMYGTGAPWKGKERSLVCDAYTRLSAILKVLPKNSINLRERETFEQSAQRALKNGEKSLASKLYELAGLGWYVGPEGYGRFRNEPIDRDNKTTSWEDSYLQEARLMRLAADLAIGTKEKRRLLSLGRDITAVMSTTSACEYEKDHVVEHGYPECKQARGLVWGFDIDLRLIKEH